MHVSARRSPTRETASPSRPRPTIGMRGRRSTRPGSTRPSACRDRGAQRSGALVPSAGGPLRRLPGGRGLGEEVSLLAQLAVEHQVIGMVVGLPVDLRGEEDEWARRHACANAAPPPALVTGGSPLPSCGAALRLTPPPPPSAPRCARTPRSSCAMTTRRVARPSAPRKAPRRAPLSQRASPAAASPAAASPAAARAGLRPAARVPQPGLRMPLGVLFWDERFTSRLATKVSERARLPRPFLPSPPSPLLVCSPRRACWGWRVGRPVRCV